MSAGQFIGLIIPLAFFASLVAVIVVPMFLKSVEQRRMHETIRVAMEKGQTLPAEVVEALASSLPHPQRDLRAAVVWIALGLGCIVFTVCISMISYAERVIWPMLGLSSFPMLIGLAYLVFWMIGRRMNAR